MRSFLLSLFIFFFLFAEAGAERLVLKYRVSWLGMKAGKIKFVVEEVLKEYFFDQRRGVVVRRKKGRESTYRLEHYPVHDELSAFYATMRARFKEAGEEKVFWVFARKKANKSTVRYLEDEKLDTPCGPWWAKKLEVEFGFESELIKRSKRAYLWQAKGLILKSQGELAIGHVTGKLVNLDCKEERP